MKSNRRIQYCPHYSIRFCASVPVIRKAMEKEEEATKKCSEREVTPPAPLHKPKIVRPAFPLCLLGLLPIPLALLELNCFAGPHQPYPKQRN